MSETKATEKNVTEKNETERKAVKRKPDSIFNTLKQIDVKTSTSEVTDSNGKKLKYLTWARAWEEVKSRYPDAKYEVKKFGENGVPFQFVPNIGYIYRRQDEIGTPFCVTYDFETEETGMVTVRDRDTMEQVSVKIEDVAAYIEEKLKF